MHDFHYVRGKLHCEQVAVEELAMKHGTPLFVYSQKTITGHYRRLDQALAPLRHLICYALKANSNLAVLNLLASEGAGFDIVSQGELQRVLEAGGDPRNCIFAGVGKTSEEIEFALKKGIYSFNVESEPELHRINSIAKRLRKTAPVAIRINPNVDAGTHAKITTGTYENKFGIAFEEVEAVYAQAARFKNLRLRGIQMHIGSQLTDVKPFEKAVQKVVPLVHKLSSKYGFEFFSIGGGIGIVYDPALESGSASWWKSKQGRQVITPQTYADTLVPLLEPLDLNILLEPGRFIAGNAGILLTRIEYVKQTGHKNFVIVDAAMNDLIRPAFYDAYHEIIPASRKSGTRISSDVVGPVCESGDYFCKDRPLCRLREGDSLAILSAGAYGFVMASNYNSRPMPAEVMVNGSKYAVVRKRQKFQDLWALEQIPSWLK